MGKKVKVKTKTTVRQGGKKPVKPLGKPSSGLLTEKIVLTVKENKGKKKSNA